MKILEEELRKLKSTLASNTDPDTAGELRKEYLKPSEQLQNQLMS